MKKKRQSKVVGVELRAGGGLDRPEKLGWSAGDMVKQPGNKMKNNKMKIKNEMTTNITKTSWRFSQASTIAGSFYSESEPDFSNFAINFLSTFALIFSESKSESDDSESDFNSVFMNLDICVFFILYLHSSK